MFNVIKLILLNWYTLNLHFDFIDFCYFYSKLLLQFHESKLDDYYRSFATCS